jgi:HEAT repeat protein
MAEGTLAVASGDTAAAASLGTQALDLFRAQGDLFWQTVSLSNLALTRVLVDDMAGAAACHQEMLAISESRTESFHTGFSAMALGIGWWKQGDLDAAETQMVQSLRSIRRLGDTLTSSWSLEVTAWIAAGRADDPDTLPLMRELATTDPDHGVRLTALREIAAGWANDPTTLPLLRKRASSDLKWEIRQAAIKAIAARWPHDPHTLPLLRKRAAKDQHDEVRLTADILIASGWADAAGTQSFLDTRAQAEYDAYERRRQGWFHQS